jgi:hypothetical protein
MIPQELADQVRSQVQSLKQVQDQFLQTYKRLCVHFGGAEWQKKKIDRTFHEVRREVIPIMEQAGLEHAGIQALCSWAEKLALQP